MTLDTLAKLTDYLTKIDIDKQIRPPPNCPTYRLSEVLEAKKGQVPELLTPEFNQNSKPYINIKAFERGIIEYYVESDDGIPVTGKDLIMVWDGARCGLVSQGKDGILGSTLKKLSLKREFEKVPLTYIRFFLEKNYRYLNTYSRGSVIQHVDSDLFWKLKIPIPNQNGERFHKISILLNTLEKIEKHTNNQLQLVQEMRKSLLNTSFLNLGK